MRPERYHAEDLIRLLRPRKIATMSELKAALGTQADATVFRKLDSFGLSHQLFASGPLLHPR